MDKPLFRWTVGTCLPQGLDILVESINKTTRALGFDRFDWAICYNGLNAEKIEFLKKAIGNRPIYLVPQDWSACPIDDNCRSPLKMDGHSYEWNGNICGGSLWKVCPARVRMETHEIVMDNDVVLLKLLPQIDEFLANKDKALILEEPIRFYGRYDNLFPLSPQGPFLNSGLMGFPPGYDFGAEIRKNWMANGSYMNLSQADEQGLLVYTLNQIPSIRIDKTQIIELLARDYSYKVTGREYGIHFTQSNKIPHHRSWLNYMEMLAKSISL